MSKRKKNNTANLLMYLIVLLSIILCCGILVISMMPDFSLKVDSVSIGVGSDFDPMAYIDSIKNAATSDIIVSSQVNTNKPGGYSVSYTLGKQIRLLKVEVIDNQAPVITLKESFVTITEGEVPDVNAVASAEDLSATMLSFDYKGNNISVPGEYTISVVCKDAAGNTSEKEIKLIVSPFDTTAPTISGAENVTIMVGDFFDPSDVTVTDNQDPAPLLSVDNGGLDVSKAGTYTIIYTAQDANGNKSVVRRTVTVTKDYVPIMYTPQGGTFAWDVRGIKNQPYLVMVNRAMNTITVYGKDEQGNYTNPVKAIVCSVAREGYETPTGRYQTTDRYSWCYMQDGSKGRYAIRIIRGIMFHSVCYFDYDISTLEYEEYNKLGSPASLGCIRMCVADEKWLYDNCPEGFTVEIYDDTALDGPLGKPVPIKIDVNNTALRGWDPTDWDPANPWNK